MRDQANHLMSLPADSVNRCTLEHVGNLSWVAKEGMMSGLSFMQSLWLIIIYL